MKTFILNINKHIIIYFFIILGSCIAAVPADAIGIDWYNMCFDVSVIDIVTVLFMVVFSLISAIIVEKIMHIDNNILLFPIVLFAIDPLLKVSLNTVNFLLVSLISLVLFYYIYVGKSFIIKSIFTAICLMVFVLVFDEVLFSHIPIVFFVYALSLCSNDNSKQTKVKNNKGNGSSHISIGIKSGVIIILAVVVAITMMLRENIASRVNFFNTFIIQYADAFLLYKSFKVWVVILSYVVILFLFLKEYITIKTKPEKTLTQKIIKSIKYWMPILLVYLIMLFGAFKYNYFSSVVLLNSIVPVSIITYYFEDRECVKLVIDKWISFLKKNEIVFYALLIAWLLITQYLFKGYFITIRDRITEMVGYLL